MEQEELVKKILIKRPHLADLEHLIENIGYGKLNICFTVVGGTVQSMEVVARQLIRYDKGEKLTTQK